MDKADGIPQSLAGLLHRNGKCNELESYNTRTDHMGEIVGREGRKEERRIEQCVCVCVGGWYQE